MRLRPKMIERSFITQDTDHGSKFYLRCVNSLSDLIGRFVCRHKHRLQILAQFCIREAAVVDFDYSKVSVVYAEILGSLQVSPKPIFLANLYFRFCVICPSSSLSSHVKPIFSINQRSWNGLWKVLG